MIIVNRKSNHLNVYDKLVEDNTYIKKEMLVVHKGNLIELENVKVRDIVKYGLSFTCSQESGCFISSVTTDTYLTIDNVYGNQDFIDNINFYDKIITPGKVFLLENIEHTLEGTSTIVLRSLVYASTDKLERGCYENI